MITRLVPSTMPDVYQHGLYSWADIQLDNNALIPCAYSFTGTSLGTYDTYDSEVEQYMLDRRGEFYSENQLETMSENLAQAFRLIHPLFYAMLMHKPYHYDNVIIDVRNSVRNRLIVDPVPGVHNGLEFGSVYAFNHYKHLFSISILMPSQNIPDSYTHHISIVFGQTSAPDHTIVPVLYADYVGGWFLTNLHSPGIEPGLREQIDATVNLFYALLPFYVLTRECDYAF